MKNIFILGVSSLMLAVPQGLLAQSDTTFVAVGNPIVKHKFIADPAAMVHDGKCIFMVVMMSVLHRKSIMT